MYTFVNIHHHSPVFDFHPSHVYTNIDDDAGMRGIDLNVVRHSQPTFHVL
jgi:hypothetical protein